MMAGATLVVCWSKGGAVPNGTEGPEGEEQRQYTGLTREVLEHKQSA